MELGFQTHSVLKAGLSLGVLASNVTAAPDERGRGRLSNPRPAELCRSPRAQA